MHARSLLLICHNASIRSWNIQIRASALSWPVIGRLSLILALIGQFCFRLAGAPGKLEFLRNGMNVIDVLAVLPYYVELGMANMETGAGENNIGDIENIGNNVTYRSDAQDQYDTQTVVCMRWVQWPDVVEAYINFFGSVFWCRPLTWWRRRRTTCRASSRCSGCSSSPGSSSWPGDDRLSINC